MMDAKPSASYLAESKVADVISSQVITYVIAVVAVALRFAARRMRSLPWWWDDWLVLGGLISATAWLAIMAYWVANGLGVHYQTVTSMSYDEYLKRNLLGLFIEETFYSITTALVKLSILCFYWRLFNRSSIRWPIRIVGGVIVAWLIARILTIFLHCVPLEGYWDKSVTATCGVNDRTFFLATNSLNILNDIILLALPLPYIKRLHINGSQKTIILGMFMFGGMITVFSVVTLVVCFSLDPKSPDVGWQITPVVIWAGSEINLAVTCACLPSLRPILLICKRKIFGSAPENSTTAGTYGYTSGSSGPSFRKPGTFQSFASRIMPNDTIDERDDDKYTLAGHKVHDDIELADSEGDRSSQEDVIAAPPSAHLSTGDRRDLKRFEIQVQNDVRVDVSDKQRNQSAEMLPHGHVSGV